MVTFSFREYGENLGTRPLGKRVREQLMPLLEQNERIVLDFTGVNVVSNSFADECIAKLLLTMPLSELKSRTTYFPWLKSYRFRECTYSTPKTTSCDGINSRVCII